LRRFGRRWRTSSLIPDVTGARLNLWGFPTRSAAGFLTHLPKCCFLSPGLRTVEFRKGESRRRPWTGASDSSSTAGVMNAKHSAHRRNISHRGRYIKGESKEVKKQGRSGTSSASPNSSSIRPRVVHGGSIFGERAFWVKSHNQPTTIYAPKIPTEMLGGQGGGGGNKALPGFHRAKSGRSIKRSPRRKDHVGPTQLSSARR